MANKWPREVRPSLAQAGRNRPSFFHVPMRRRIARQRAYVRIDKSAGQPKDGRTGRPGTVTKARRKRINTRSFVISAAEKRQLNNRPGR